MFYKLLKFLQLFNTQDKTQPVWIMCDASGKHRYAAIVVAFNGQIQTLRFKCQESSALAELEALQASLELSIMYLMLGYEVQIRNDNRGVIHSFTKAIAGLSSDAPICKKMLDFVNQYDKVFHTKKLKVRWLRGHVGYSLNEIVDWLTRNESYENINKFDYFDTVKNFQEKT